MAELRRDLGIWGAAAIVVGTVIGSGIFLVPKAMIQSVGSSIRFFRSRRKSMPRLRLRWKRQMRVRAGL